MSEASTIAATPWPRTWETLAADLRALGLKAGNSVIVHSALSKVGWINGGPTAMISALQEVLTTEGTLVMPTQSGQYSDPAGWQNPSIPEAWHEEVRRTMPAYDPATAPTRGMGKLPEAFRTYPDVFRSQHPTLSFAAWGKHAQRTIKNHTLDFALGEGSPLARMYEGDFHILLIGVGYDSCTAMHLAEHRAPLAIQVVEQTPLSVEGKTVWQARQDIEMDADLFPAIGEAFEAAHQGAVWQGMVGSAPSRFFPLPTAVDFAQQWLTAYRIGQTNAGAST
jgi:aminoglycoside 3-N-acetyltransferase